MINMNMNMDSKLFMDCLTKRVFEELGGDVDKPYESAIKLLNRKDMQNYLSIPGKFEKDCMKQLKNEFRRVLKGKQKKFIISLTKLEPVSTQMLKKDLGWPNSLSALRRDTFISLDNKFPENFRNYLEVIYLKKTKEYKMVVDFSLLKKLFVSTLP